MENAITERRWVPPYLRLARDPTEAGPRQSVCMSQTVCVWDSHKTYAPMTLSAQYEGNGLRFKPSSAFTPFPACIHVSFPAQNGGE